MSKKEKQNNTVELTDKLIEILTTANKDKVEACGGCVYFCKKNDPFDFTASAGDCKLHNQFVFSFKCCKDYKENPIKPLGYKTKQMMKEDKNIDNENWLTRPIKCVESGEVFESAKQLCDICHIPKWKLVLSLYGYIAYEKINGLSFVPVLESDL